AVVPFTNETTSGGTRHGSVRSRGARRGVPHLLAYRRRGRGLGRVGRPVHEGLHLLRALLRVDAGPGRGPRMVQAGDGALRRDLHRLRVAHDRPRARAGDLLHAEPARRPERPGHARLPGRLTPRVRWQRPVEARGGLLGLEAARGGDEGLRGGLPAPRSRAREEEDALALGEWSRVDPRRAGVRRAPEAALSPRLLVTAAW